MNSENTSDKSQAQALNKTAVKCRFFAQYWGTKTMYVGGVGLVEIGKGGWNLNHPDFFLELKPLSKISDEDCILIFNKFFPNAIKYSDAEKIYDIKSSIKSNFSEDVIIDEDFIFYTDFMRSKGYAVPFMEYSVEDLVSFGWVRLV